MKKYIWLIISLSMLSVMSFAQLKGRVVDALDKQPLAGAIIKISNINQTFSTDQNGYFNLQLKNGIYVLSIHSLGYIDQQKNISVPINSDLIFELIAESNSLKEVQVLSTGYQNIPKERATGSFATINKNQFDNQVSLDVISRLKSIAPSLLFDERSGKIRLSLRGRSTIYANDQPLIVVDGFPYDGDLTNLNPNDIENITLLKDAAAASIWGVKAGNGVIVISTKTAKKAQPLQIEGTLNYSVAEKPNLFNNGRISSADFIDAEKRWYALGFYNADLSNTTNYAPISPVVNLLDKAKKGLLSNEVLNTQLATLAGYDVRHDLEQYLYANKQLQQYNLALSQGFSNYQYRLNASFDKNQNSLKGNSLNRVYISAKQAITFSDRLSFDISTQLIQNQSRLEPLLSNLFTGGPNGKQLYPYAQLADAEGNALAILKDYRDDYKASMESKGFLNWAFVPLNELKYSNNNRKQTEYRLNSALRYRLNTAFSAELRYQYESQNGKVNNIQDENSYYSRNLINRYTSSNGTVLTKAIPNGAIVDQSDDVLNRQSLRAQVNYAQTFGTHELNVIAGAEAREVNAKGTYHRYYGYDPLLGTMLPVNYTTAYALVPDGFALIPNYDNISQTTERYRSFYANGAYTFQNQYIVSASARVDQSNFFGVAANQRAVPLWSAGAKWLISNASFYKFKALPKLSLRLSYGYNGNLDRSVTAYTTAGLSTSSTTGQAAATIYTPPNPNLSWEKIGVFNAGLDFSVKNEWLSGSIEYYVKNGNNLLGNAILDPTTGLKSYRGNVAGMQTKGLDVVLNATWLKRAFTWQTSLLWSYVTDKVTSYAVNTSLATYFTDASLEGNSTALYAPTVGKPLFGVYSRKWAGLNPVNGNPMGFVNGKPSDDYTALLSLTGKTVDSLVYHGRALPPVFGSLGNTFNYKGFSLSFNVNYRFGYYFIRPSINYSSLFTTGNGHEDYALRWQKAGDELFTQVPSFTDQLNANRDAFYTNSEILVEKGDHIRLQDISLAYNFPLKANAYLKRLNIYLYINNLGILWKASETKIDPDYPTQALPRVYAFGLKFTL